MSYLFSFVSALIAGISCGFVCRAMYHVWIKSKITKTDLIALAMSATYLTLYCVMYLVGIWLSPVRELFENSTLPSTLCILTAFLTTFGLIVEEKGGKHR